MKTLFSLFFRAFPLESGSIVVLSLLAVVLEGVGFGLLLPILDSLGDSEVNNTSNTVSRFFLSIFDSLGIKPTILILTVSGVTLFIAQALLKCFQVIVTANACAKAERKLRTGAFGQLLKAELGYFHQRKLGDMSNAITKEAERGATGFVHLARLFVFALLGVAYLGIGAALSWLLVLTTVGLGIAFVLIFSRRRNLHDIGESVRIANENLESTTVENIIGIRDVKVFGLYDLVNTLFFRRAGAASEANRILRRVLALRTFFYETSALVMVLGLVAIGIQLLTVDTTIVVAFLAILFRVRSAMIQGQAALDGIVSCLPGLVAVQELQRSANASFESLPSGDKSVPLSTEIEISEVSFAYEKQDPVLRDVSIHMPANCVTAIVGASGAGKSTLADLIARFFDPTQGQILVGGVDLRDLNADQWRSQIGFVSQDTFLFNDSVTQNILYGYLEAKKDDVLRAAKLAQVDGFVSEWPSGYDTIVGDRGVRLSGGQRQRIAIARAALRDPRLLILDEATSGLDSKSEAALQRSFADLSKGRTVMVIAHRLSTIRKADQIVVLDKGRVVEIGDHQSLIKSGGHYAEFYHLQVGDIR